MSLDYFNGLAGLAALVNSLLMWPVIRSLKHLAHNHDTRITHLENLPKKKKRRAR